jgi:hypothetical protein
MTTIVPESACANARGKVHSAAHRKKRAIHSRKTLDVYRKLAFNGVPTYRGSTRRDSGTAILYAADHDAADHAL